MKKLMCGVVAVLALVLWAPAGNGQDPGGSLSEEERLFGLSLIWKEAAYNFAFFDQVPGLDWDKAYREAIAPVRDATDTLAYYRELQRFTAQLREGHTDVVPPRELRDRFSASPALEVEEVGRQAVVVNVSLDLAGAVPVGSVILRVDGLPVSEYLAERVLPFMSAATEHSLWRRAIRGHRWTALGLLLGEEGSEVDLEIEIPEGERRNVKVNRLDREASVDWKLPARGGRPILELRWVDERIALVSLNTFNDAGIVEKFESILPELRRAGGIILDVRENGGGNSLNGWKIGRHFAAGPVPVQRWRSPQHVAVFKAWSRFEMSEKRRELVESLAWYEGTPGSLEPAEGEALLAPTAVLMGSSTYSAAEDFLVFMKQISHVFLVGSRSAGSTGQPLVLDLPGGGKVGITAKRDVMPDGTEFVGYGVEPDLPAEQTVEALRAGRDLVLEAAVKALGLRLQEDRG